MVLKTCQTKPNKAVPCCILAWWTPPCYYWALCTARDRTRKTLGREPAWQEASLGMNRSKTGLREEQCPLWTTSFTTIKAGSAGQPGTWALDKQRPKGTRQLRLVCFKRSLPNKETNYILKTFHRIHALFFLCLISSLLEAWLLPKGVQSNAWW